MPSTGLFEIVTIRASYNARVTTAILDAAAALAALEAALRSSPGMLVAFSGGVDSSVLLAVAHRVLADRVVAMTADSPSMPRRELRAACEMAKTIGVRHLIRQTEELDLDNYRRNDASRCYWCKHTLFAVCEGVARDLDLPEIAYGYTADDVNDVRPGHRAAMEFGVRSPLLEAGLHKPEIRAVARQLALPVWDKPAAPCLSSRIPHGSDVSIEKLRQIELVEDLLSELGFRVYRARFDGRQMRIEVASDEISRAATPQIRTQILNLTRQLRIPLVTLDLEGFRSGKLNELA